RSGRLDRADLAARGVEADGARGVAVAARLLLRPEDARRGLERGVESIRLAGGSALEPRGPRGPAPGDVRRAERGPRLSLGRRPAPRQDGGDRAPRRRSVVRRGVRILADPEDLPRRLPRSQGVVAARAPRSA